MGIGAPMVGLYYELARAGALSDVRRIIEFGSQDMHCSGYSILINKTIEALGHPPLPPSSAEALSNSGPARTFYESLGWEYHCLDTDGRHGAITIDLNFDCCPEQHKNAYDIATNFGTTEHLINQLNAFRVLHDLTKANGLMLHISPFVGCVDHGFFTYQPNFYYALSRYNGYEILGIWLNPNTSLSSLIPWQAGMLNRINISPTTDAVIVVALRKKFGADFQLPFQRVYEETQVPDNAARYCFVVDGEILNGARIAALRAGNLSSPSRPPDQLSRPISLPRRVARYVARRTGLAQKS
jgi:hypothetical protein